MTYRPTQGPPPSDEQCAQAWDEIMRIAREHAMIAQAYGGVAVLMVPSEQREEEGLRERVLKTHMMELEES